MSRTPIPPLLPHLQAGTQAAAPAHPPHSDCVSKNCLIMGLMAQHSPSPNPASPWPTWSWSGAQLRSQDCTVILCAGSAAHLTTHSAKQLQVCCSGRFLRAMHFGKSSSTENTNLPLALIAPKLERGDKPSYNINHATLLTARTVPMWIAARFTPPSAHLIYLQKDLYVKNVLYLHANHSYLPSEEYLEHTVYLVHQNTVSPPILPPLGTVIPSQLSTPSAVHFAGATEPLCDHHLCICLTSCFRHRPCLGPLTWLQQLDELMLI